MNANDVYERWKSQRSSIEAPGGFESKVMAALVESNSDGGRDLRPTVARFLDRPAWATAAVFAASIVGLLRVAVALFIGIQSQ